MSWSSDAAASPRLVCLPPAGAGPALFLPWLRADPAIEAPALPGREARFAEQAPTDLAGLADQIAAEMAPRLQGRFGLFGYSMGGTTAFLVAERLAGRGLPQPEALFLLGAPPPHRLQSGTGSLHALERDAFWAEIARIGGTPRTILEDAEMRALLEPILRADFRLCETYRHGEGGFRLACPVHVFVAEDDHLVDADSAEDWAAFSDGPTRLHRLPGGHMLQPQAFFQLRERIRALWPQPSRAF